MSVLVHALKDFVLAVVFGLLPFALGYWLGWIMRGEHDGRH